MARFNRPGGRLRAAMARHPAARRVWRDLSLRLNSWPRFAWGGSARAWTRLTDPVVSRLRSGAMGFSCVGVVGATRGGHAEARRAEDARVRTATRPLARAIGG